ALTTFFPRWYMEDQAEVDSFFETEMPNAVILPLYRAAAELGVWFVFGYAEIAGKRRFNTALLVDPSGNTRGKYRKIHLPGHRDHQPWRPFQHLEKRYFDTGDLGFRAFDAMGTRIGLCTC